MRLIIVNLLGEKQDRGIANESSERCKRDYINNIKKMGE